MERLTCYESILYQLLVFNYATKKSLLLLNFSKDAIYRARVEVTRRCPNHYGIPGQTLRDGAWKGGAGPWLILLVSTAQTALPDAISRRLVLHGRSFRRR